MSLRMLVGVARILVRQVCWPQSGRNLCRVIICKSHNIIVASASAQHHIPYFRDQTPRLLFISSRDFPRPLFEGGH